MKVSYFIVSGGSKTQQTVRTTRLSRHWGVTSLLFISQLSRTNIYDVQFELKKKKKGNVPVFFRYLKIELLGVTSRQEHTHDSTNSCDINIGKAYRNSHVRS